MYLYTFGLCSLWHLAAVSVVKCSVIVRPLTHYTIFTDRVIRAIIFAIWILSLLVIVAINAGAPEVQFNWITIVAQVESQDVAFAYGIGGLTFVIATLIIMIAYTKVFLAVRRQTTSQAFVLRQRLIAKGCFCWRLETEILVQTKTSTSMLSCTIAEREVFLVVRRQMRSMPTDVVGSYGSRTIFGSSVRSAKNLFVMCAAYYLTYVPVNIGLVLRTGAGLVLPEALQFAVTWIYISSAALDGFLYTMSSDRCWFVLTKCLSAYYRRTLCSYGPFIAG